MKLLLDLQGAQSQSRHRGIGRYTLALTRAFLDRVASEHDVRLLLNARFGDHGYMQLSDRQMHAADMPISCVRSSQVRF